ncbi:MAG: DNA/RNA nuclease SfsA [Thaumarchaeota archaeon]|nr:DNA/RNA nuclease SfsA [Candidatus Geocrenenecus arthurdayi]MCL7391131.1 DNA/RNA nuclease SfsA [Candidatus Geocrenenecus arthurdayi]
MATDSGKTFRLHLTNTGRLNDLVYPGSEILYINLLNGRRVSGRVVGVWLGDSAALIDTILQARMFEKALELELIPWLQGYKVERREVIRYGSRFDYLLSNGLDEIILELKSAVYLSHDGAAMYPDTISERGIRHFEILNKLKLMGKNTSIVFIAAHPYARYFRPNFDIDPRLKTTLCTSLKLDTLIKSIKMHLERDGSVILDDADLPVMIKC